MNKLTLSQAFEGFLLDKQASGRSLHTISSYRNSISKALTFFDSDPVVQSMRRQDWIRFFAWLQDEHVSVPGGVAPRPPCYLSPKSVANIHTDLSAFYTWATSPGVELVGDHILRTIDRPLIETFSKTEIAALLKACDDGRAVNLSGEHRARSMRHRDRAIIHVLLSTGVRASELCDMRVKDGPECQEHPRRRQGQGTRQQAAHRVLRTYSFHGDLALPLAVHERAQT